MSQTNKDNPESAQTLELLENTIAQLNSILTELGTNKKAPLPPLASVQNLASSTEELAKLLGVSTSSPTEEKFEPKGLDRILPSFTTLDSWWNGLLAKIHELVPFSRTISDLGLTGIVTGIVVVLLLGSVLFFSLPSQQVTQVKQTTQEEETKPPFTREIPQQEREIAKKVEPPTQPAKESSQPKVSPNPPLELTPEQSLIAAIQKQVAEITGQYAEGLILSIEANFLSSRLRVTLGDSWYGLTERKQQQLANEMLERSQQLDFRKLELIDSQDNLLARSPVVGSNMVILQR
jgi:hypothetical protein